MNVQLSLVFVFRNISKIWPKTVLDVGTGKNSSLHMMCNCGLIVTAIDNIKRILGIRCR